jgi:cytochrome P450
VWALGRFDDVRAALRADEALVSGRGVALNDFVNAQSAGTTLASDGELHRARRALIMKPMMPSALRAVRGEIERLADELVADLAKRDGFDGIADFARHLPVAVVSHPRRAARGRSRTHARLGGRDLRHARPRERARPGGRCPRCSR